jgi:hypothetical protein
MKRAILFLTLSAVLLTVACECLSAQSAAGSMGFRDSSVPSSALSNDGRGRWNVDSIDFEKIPHLASRAFDHDGSLSQNSEAAASIVISGTLQRPDGTGYFGQVNFWNRATGMVVATTNSTIDGQFQVEMPPGEYGYYVRIYGLFPYMAESIVLMHDTTLIFRLPSETGPTASFVQSTLWSPLAVYANGSDMTRLQLTTLGSVYDSLFVVNEQGVLKLNNGTSFKIRLYDDGTHGDLTAGDGIATRGGITYDGSTPSRGGRLGSVTTLFMIAYRQGSPELYRLPAAQLCLVNPQIQRAILNSGNGYQVSDHVFNKQGFMTSATMYNESRNAMKLFYAYFPDEFDFAYIFADNPEFFGGSLHMTIRNDISGIGSDRFDISGQWGSSSVLSAVNFFPPRADVPLLHETVHSWAAHMDPLFECSRFGGHWGYSSVNGMLGGFDGSQLVSEGGGVYSGPFTATNGWAGDDRGYAWLELYAMGLAGLQEVPTHQVLVNGQGIGNNRYSADSLRVVTPQRLEATMGPRIPGWQNSQKSFKGAFVVVSRELLNPAGMAFFSVLAEIFGGELDTLNNVSFAKATRNRAVMDTRLSGYAPLPPSVPLLQEPATHSAGLWVDGVLFSWTRVKRADTYTLQISTDSTFGLTSMFQEITQQDTFIGVWGFAFGTQYFWRVKATNSAGFTFSSVSEFTTILGNLDFPVAVYPPTYSAVVPVDVVLRWHRVAGATMYHIQVTKDLYATLAVDDTVKQDTVYQCNLEANTKYWWRLRAMSPKAQSVVNPCGYFYTQPWAKGPTLLSPANGSMFSNTQVLLKWAWLPPINSTHHVQVALDSLFQPGSSTFVLNDTVMINGLETYPTWVSTFASHHTYYWRVRVVGTSHVSPFSSTWSYSIFPAPAMVNLVSPADREVVPNDTVRLVWRQGTPRGTKYWLEYSVDSTFAGKFMDSTLVDTLAVVDSLESGRTIWWRVRARNGTGWGPYSFHRQFRILITDVEREDQVPTTYRLDQNYPNPFNPTTTIRYALPRRSHVTLAIYNTLGQQVATLVNGDIDAGFHDVTFKAGNLGSGVYLYRLQTGDFVETRKLLLVR